MQTAIELKNVTKQFQNTVAVNNVSATFESGKIHGIIGRNGSGKTVLFKCICGLYPVTNGEIVVFDRTIGDGKQVPRSIGAIIENPGFLPNCTGFQNLLYLMSLSSHLDKEKIRSTITLVGLDPTSKKHVGKYSMGMRQRLGIAQAIMEDPKLLILDEPMNGLDKSGVSDIRQLLLNLKDQGKTILLASHNAEDINVLCDTIYEMDAGCMNRVK